MHFGPLNLSPRYFATNNFDQFGPLEVITMCEPNHSYASSQIFNHLFQEI